MTAIGHIYKIICNVDEKFCYIGSTFDRLDKRMKGHRNGYHQWLNGDPRACACYEYFQKYGIDNFKMILIKSYEVVRTHNKDRKHLESYETLWINKTKCCNKQVAFNPLKKEQKKQHCQDNKEYHKSYSKKWCRDNQELLAVKKKQYRQTNKEKINMWQKQYYEANREAIKTRERENYAKNREKVLARRRELAAQK